MYDIVNFYNLDDIPIEFKPNFNIKEINKVDNLEFHKNTKSQNNNDLLMLLIFVTLFDNSNNDLDAENFLNIFSHL